MHNLKPLAYTNHETLVVTTMLFLGNQGLDIRGEHKLPPHILIAIQFFGKAKNSTSAILFALAGFALALVLFLALPKDWMAMEICGSSLCSPLMSSPWFPKNNI